MPPVRSVVYVWSTYMQTTTSIQAAAAAEVVCLVSGASESEAVGVVDQSVADGCL